MFLSRTCEHGLRLMACMAVQPYGSAIRSPDLAEWTLIPARETTKVLRMLVEHGLLVARKGRAGGYVMARPPEQIFFSEVFAATQGTITANRCTFGWGTCDPTNPCLLHGAMCDINRSVVSWAGNTSLADIIARPGVR